MTLSSSFFFLPQLVMSSIHLSTSFTFLFVSFFPFCISPFFLLYLSAIYLLFPYFLPTYFLPEFLSSCLAPCVSFFEVVLSNDLKDEPNTTSYMKKRKLLGTKELSFLISAASNSLFSLFTYLVH